MPILGVIASSKLGTPAGTFISLATLNVTSDTNTSSLSFTGIPSTYVRLQVRAFIRTNRADSQDNIVIRFNGDSTSGNYSTHQFYGAGGNSTTTPVADNYASASGVGSSGMTGLINGNSNDSNLYSPFVLDINNYSSTQYKSARFWGASVFDSTTLNRTGLIGGNWRNTSSLISSISFSTLGSQIKAGSYIALYGIKGA